MKIIHISTSDKEGGASKAAYRLHNAMIKAGFDSKYLVLRRTIYDRSDIIGLSTLYMKIKSRFNGLVMRLGKTHELFSSFRYGIDISKIQEVMESDIIYIHWINMFIDYRVLKQILKTGKPVFWYLRDMFPITGGCHYSFECVKYRSYCHNCIYIIKKFWFYDPALCQYKIKKHIYNKYNNLSFIAQSKWTLDCAKNSGLTAHKKIYFIPNVIDPIFRPFDKEIARKLFFIENNKKIIGFGANAAITNPCKGWDYLKKALWIILEDSSLQAMEIELLVFGSSFNKEVVTELPIKSHFLGQLDDEYSLAMVYNALDVFVIPSTAESFGQTVIESLAADVPVVGFNVGGISDTVNSETGYLAEYKNSADLAKGISLILRNPPRNVRKHVEKFSADVILNKHKKMWDNEHVSNNRHCFKMPEVLGV
jgi:glycosyltransferase involved in cell wall biosynthesis